MGLAINSQPSQVDFLTSCHVLGNQVRFASKRSSSVESSFEKSVSASYFSDIWAFLYNNNHSFNMHRSRLPQSSNYRSNYSNTNREDGNNSRDSRGMQSERLDGARRPSFSPRRGGSLQVQHQIHDQDYQELNRENKFNQNTSQMYQQRPQNINNPGQFMRPEQHKMKIQSQFHNPGPGQYQPRPSQLNQNKHVQDQQLMMEQPQYHRMENNQQFGIAANVPPNTYQQQQQTTDMSNVNTCTSIIQPNTVNYQQSASQHPNYQQSTLQPPNYQQSALRHPNIRMFNMNTASQSSVMHQQHRPTVPQHPNNSMNMTTANFRPSMQIRPNIDSSMPAPSGNFRPQFYQNQQSQILNSPWTDNSQQSSQYNKYSAQKYQLNVQPTNMTNIDNNYFQSQPKPTNTDGPSDKMLKRKKKITCSVSIHNKQDVMRSLIVCMAKLKRQFSKLEKTVESADDGEWQSDFGKIEKLKKSLLEHHSTFKDVDEMKNFEKIVSKRRKKRERMKKQKIKRFEEKQYALVQREIKEAKIDKWRDSVTQKILDAKQKVEMKAMADKTLGEVRSKISDTSRKLDLLKGLQRLRKIRMESAVRIGRYTPNESETVFETEISSAYDILTKQREVYEAEEKTLKVLLEAEQEESKDQANQRKQQIQEQRKRQRLKKKNEMLFGKEVTKEPTDPLHHYYEFYNQANNNFKSFIDTRHSWDCFIVQAGASGGSRIPDDWVQPALPSNSTWAKYLKS